MNFNKIDHYISKVLKYLLPLIFFVPFVVSSEYYFPYITPRNFLFRIIVSIVLAFYLYLFFRHKEKYSFGRNKVILSYLFLALILTVSSFLNGDFLYSFWSNYERMDGLVTIYYLIALLLVILGLYRNKKDWLNLLRISVWSSFIMALIALSQHWGINIFIQSSGGDRVTGALGNATYLAVYSLFNLFFALYLLLKHSNQKPKLELWSFYILDVLLIIAEVFTDGKGFLGGIFSDIRLALLFIIPQIFINLQYYFSKLDKIVKYSSTSYFVLIILLNFLALFNTQTRGVLVGIFIAFIFIGIFLLASKYVKRKIKYYIVGVLLIFILFISSIFIFKNTGFIQNNNTLRRVAGISISDATTETRLLTWQASLRGFVEKPILGWGEEKFYVVFNKYFPNEIFKGVNSRVWFDRPHNVFLQQLVHGGILGFLAYISIFIFAFINLFKHYKKTHDPKTISILGGLLIAYLVQNFFVFDSINSYIFMVLFLAISIFLSGDFTSSKKLSIDKPLAFVSLFLVLALSVWLIVPKMITNKAFISDYKDLQISIGQGQYQKESLNNFLEILDRQYLGKFELRQVYAEFVPNLIQAQILSPIETQYFVDTAESKLVSSIEEQPDNVRHHSFLVNLYFRASILDPSYSQKGIDLIENQALKLSPSRVQLYYALGQFYLNLGEVDKAIENFTKAKQLAPTVFDSYYNFIYIYLSISKEDSLDSILNEMYTNVKMTKDNYIRLAGLYNFFERPEDVNKIMSIVEGL